VSATARHGHSCSSRGTLTAEQLYGCRPAAAPADWSTALDYRSAARDRRSANLSVMSRRRHRVIGTHGLRIINVAVQCTNHGRACRCPPPGAAVQIGRFHSNCAGASRFAECMPNARLAVRAVPLFSSIIFSSVINAHKYCGKSHARKSYLV